jgi:hypothetical protein
LVPFRSEINHTGVEKLVIEELFKTSSVIGVDEFMAE